MRKPLVIVLTLLCCSLLASCTLFATHRGFNRAMIDRNVQLTAQHALNDDPALKDRTHIAVNVYNGVLVLIGEAYTEELKQRAGADVRGYDGVQRVVNLIDVMPPQSVASTLRDASLTAEVKAALLGVKLPGFDPGQITVSTAHAKVYLMGIVSHRQGEAAAQAASKVAGVKQVVQVFEYTQ